MDKIFIVGCGDIGRRLGTLALEGGGEVFALVRSEKNVSALSQRGFNVLVGDLGIEDRIPQLSLDGATVFYLAPPPGGGFEDKRARNFCSAFSSAQPERLVYLSTSGVYGRCDDLAVSEDAAISPSTSRGRRRHDAEETFRQWGRKRGFPVMVARVTNIYGPGRLPIFHIQSGHPLLSEDEARPTSRIHSEDLARACLAIAEKGRPGDVFNVCDSDPCSMSAYFKAVARALNLEVPPEVPRLQARDIMKPLLFNCFTESRILNNDKLLNEIGFRLLYPTLAEGLKASVQSSVSSN